MRSQRSVCFQGVTNFVLYKFGHLAQKEWQTMYDLAKMFLHCVNHWKLETPAARKYTLHLHTDDVSVYKVSTIFFRNIEFWYSHPFITDSISILLISYRRFTFSTTSIGLHCPNQMLVHTCVKTVFLVWTGELYEMVMLLPRTGFLRLASTFWNHHNIWKNLVEVCIPNYEATTSRQI